MQWWVNLGILSESKNSQTEAHWDSFLLFREKLSFSQACYNSLEFVEIR